MKKVYYSALGAIALAAAILTSCGGSVSTNPTLKTETDSLSYAMGVNLQERSLSQFFNQSGLVRDTAYFKKFLEYQIEQTQDAAEKEKLAKKLPIQLDSLSRANDKNIAEFMRGFQEGIKAPDAQDAYINGLAIGRQISSRMIPEFKTNLYGEKADSIELNKNALASGVATSLLKKKLAMENASMYLDQKMEEAQNRQMMSSMPQEAPTTGVSKEGQEAAAKEFFDKNANVSGVVSLPSGLQYKIVTKGSGAKPTLADNVVAHYKGSMIDGTVFESSYDGGEPVEFPVTGVIPGWTEILQLMPAGSKWTVYIPQNLAYGARDTGKIPAYSALIFDIELIDVKKAQ